MGTTSVDGIDSSKVERMDANDLRLVCFELQHQEFALPISSVRETLGIQPITRVVLTPKCLAGVFSLRGEIVPAIDLGPLIGIAATRLGDESRIVVLKHELGLCGIVVDRLLEQRRIQEVQPPPSNLSAGMQALLKGVATTDTGIVRILDANAILEAEALRGLRTVAENKLS